ncbi:MAG: hypothetical protein LBD02_02830 [Christensenellaceae bacterium]|nr:hypothetical protein [Christensenellaceae bacterium]
MLRRLGQSLWHLCGSGDIEEFMRVSLPENIAVVTETSGAQSWENGFNPDS